MAGYDRVTEADTVKATVLVDNIRKDDMRGEWGLSIFIEYQGRRILLDTGASELFLENADKLGIDISKTDYAVLSHAHYDHADGMEAFFKRAPDACFYLREGCAENCYSKKTYFYKYIGLPRRILRRYADRIVYVSGDHELCEGVYLIPHKTEGLSELGKVNQLYIRKSGGWQADSFEHEHSLVFDTDRGLVIFNSCSHGGADNIICETARTFPEKRIRALIGGFHLFKRTDEDVRALADRIRRTGIEEIYTGHCTGSHALAILQEELGGIVRPLQVGLTMEF